ncbi:MAG: DUF4330 domain-containing protein [Oscillospiraceae bacterium]|nr:DUF4330 domain-containing protein [Oscillospiraceae bacterium]
MKKKRLNGFDIAVIGVILLGAGVWFFLANRTPPPPEEAIFAEGRATYTVEVPHLTPLQIAQVQVGDQLQEATGLIPIGQVISIETRPDEITVNDYEAQEIRLMPIEGRYVMTLMIETDVTVTDEAILADGRVLLRGGRGILFTGPGYAFSGNLLGIERGGAEE